MATFTNSTVAVVVVAAKVSVVLPTSRNRLLFVQQQQQELLPEDNRLRTRREAGARAVLCVVFEHCKRRSSYIER